MRSHRKHGFAAAAVVVAVFVAAPAIGADPTDPGVQPPPGTVDHSVDAAPVPAQPPPGTVTRTTNAAPVPKQPVNRNPQKVTKVAKVRSNDRGAKNLRPTKDRGQKNAPATRDLGAR